MAKLTKTEIEKELKIKNLTLQSDFEDYNNLNSMIKVACLNGHEIQTTLKTVRLSSFTCPVCVGQATKGFDEEPLTIPQKTGNRIIGFDNASHEMGVSIFDNGKLVFYTLLVFNEGSAIHRLNKIRDMIEKIIIPAWKPDFIQIEDIQHQNSYATYEVLVKLVGLFEMACERYNIDFAKNRSSEWRSHFGINKRKREVEKELAVERVKNMYDIDVQHDVAEAILIGKYRVDMQKKNNLQDLF